MKKKLKVAMIPVVVLFVFGFIILFRKDSNIVIDHTEPADEITEEPEIIDVLDPFGTPEASILPDPFDGISPNIITVDYFSEPENCINVKAYGALGDGLTDDYEAVLAAGIQACSEGKTLYFPAGTYYLSKRLVLNTSIEILGESMDLVTILFKDFPEAGPIEKYNQRGLVTFTADVLAVKGVTLCYYAESISAFTRKNGSSNGDEGVLFSILNGSDVTFDNCRFRIEEQNDPSITCMWVKSEVNDISNILINSCEFLNNSSSTVGGGLWVSAHDSSSTLISDVEVVGCNFIKKGNDEAFSVWGYNIFNINVHDNNFEFSNHSVKNNTLIAFGMPDANRVENIYNSEFSHNTIQLTGLFEKIIAVQLLSSDSKVEISDNIIMAHPDSSVGVSCFALYNPGNVDIIRNAIGIDGGATNSYTVYTSGNVYFYGNFFKTRNCEATMLIKSSTSQYYSGVSVRFESETFDFGSSYTNSGRPIIQLSPSGQMCFDSCDIVTTYSAIHEIRFQMLYSIDTNEYPPNSIEFRSCNFDTMLYFNMTKDSNTSIAFDDSRFRSILFCTGSNGPCIENLKIANTEYNAFMLNWKKITPKDMMDQCTELVVE